MIVKKKESGKLEIDLTGPQGNAFFLLGTAQSLTKRLNKLRGNEYLVWEEIEKDMTSGDYEHLLEVFEKHFGHITILYR
jgi:hypothetical protein